MAAVAAVVNGQPDAPPIFLYCSHRLSVFLSALLMCPLISACFPQSFPQLLEASGLYH